MLQPYAVQLATTQQQTMNPQLRSDHRYCAAMMPQYQRAEALQMQRGINQQEPKHTYASKGIPINIIQGNLDGIPRGLYQWSELPSTHQGRFAKAGKISECEVQKDASNGKSKGKATIQYSSAAGAQQAIDMFDETRFMSMVIRILKINIEMEDSATACILDLPPELVVDILTTLDKSSQKRFRLVSKGCATLTAPLLFEHIYFDFDIGGTNGLVAISRQPELCQHVHTVELRRRDGLRSFDDTDAWRAATVYEYAFDTLEDGDVEIPAGAMTHDEWVMLPDEAVQKLYDAYESDRQAVTQTDVVISGAHKSLADFGRAIARLSSASHFVHSSRYMDDDWGLRWRNVQFHHFGIMEGSTGADEDIDNIQFSALVVMPSGAPLIYDVCSTGASALGCAGIRWMKDWTSGSMPLADLSELVSISRLPLDISFG
ncbi:hypothetical protein B0A55_12762 [Friedmanniomyces simplex]|uniref:RRM domain-containing protein n=2 Tax=Friedmanniomyces simplex TaxID=329884 RepID=A0A4U0WDA0_9PEZI|nr:hypothetical protein B0A55_12762 [Friedmanniomyces simplex]